MEISVFCLRFSSFACCVRPCSECNPVTRYLWSRNYIFAKTVPCVTKIMIIVVWANSQQRGFFFSLRLTHFLSVIVRTNGQITSVSRHMKHKLESNYFQLINKNRYNALGYTHYTCIIIIIEWPVTTWCIRFFVEWYDFQGIRSRWRSHSKYVWYCIICNRDQANEMCCLTANIVVAAAAIRRQQFLLHYNMWKWKK